ncbi:ribosome assembly RNA-binding protein YhbY [Crassaminicella thermophila]|uniref:Ribosome assembly RNA-binding protein YhbY n=1 Tax=Crassaminicella thermophila TaxID=2599308 RepID=A0A5C0SGF7_CRATE|nr:ribosome assembly RNA-binding protein YhbY [Crassaminicella thermophila]QEK12039.1 ribosome assembly RNA-binding protein YhbY [Crassaminicella thermophila]
MKRIDLLTGKQRSYLKGLANGIKPIAQIGKSGITENFIKQMNDALEARELVKVHVLENSLLDTKETANEVAKLTRAEFIQAIGNKFVIYRPSKKNPKIQIPK